MAKLRFDIRDIFRLVRLGWSGKKIWVGLCGLIAAYVGYSVLVVVAHLVSGATFGQVWHRYGLFPGAAPGSHPLVGTLIDIVAMLYALVVVFLTLCMMCKITYQQLRGDDFYSSGDAWKFVKENWSGVIFGPVATLALFLFFVVAGIVIGWLAGVIPVVGELAFALSFIPIFFAALVAVFIAIGCAVAVMMSPAIVGTVGEDALEVMIQSFSMTWSQPWRLLLYTAWMEISIWVGVTVLGAFMACTMGLLSWACGLFMKEKLSNMVMVAERYVPYDFTRFDIDLILFRLNVNVADYLAEPGTPSGAEVWSGRLLAVMLILLTGVLISYAMSAYASGTSLIYVILRKRKDDENLLEWEDETFEEEPAGESPDEGEGEGEQDASSGEAGTEEGEASSSEAGKEG